MRNRELIQLLGLEKTLVFFSTSLKANEMTLEKVMRGAALSKSYTMRTEDILEDVIIESQLEAIGNVIFIPTSCLWAPWIFASIVPK